MAKKYAPGGLCVANMTLLVLVAIFAMGAYTLIAQGARAAAPWAAPSPGLVVVAASGGGATGVVGDMYAPPLRFEEPLFRGGADPRGVPINVRTRGGGEAEFSQVGILTDAREGAQDGLILPLFGRRSDTGRDKHQYYTVSNSGSLNSRLPVSLGGRSCAGEQGCDEISSGDAVMTAGYGGDFTATIYESGLNRYIPF